MLTALAGSPHAPCSPHPTLHAATRDAEAHVRRRRRRLSAVARSERDRDRRRDRGERSQPASHACGGGMRAAPPPWWAQTAESSMRTVARQSRGRGERRRTLCTMRVPACGVTVLSCPLYIQYHTYPDLPPLGAKKLRTPVCSNSTSLIKLRRKSRPTTAKTRARSLPASEKVLLKLRDASEKRCEEDQQTTGIDTIQYRTTSTTKQNKKQHQ